MRSGFYCRSRPAVEILSFAYPKESIQRKRHPLPRPSASLCYSTNQAAVQLSLVAHKLHEQLRTLNSARRKLLAGLRCSAWQQGIKGKTTSWPSFRRRPESIQLMGLVNIWYGVANLGATLQNLIPNLEIQFCG